MQMVLHRYIWQFSRATRKLLVYCFSLGPNLTWPLRKVSHLYRWRWHKAIGISFVCCGPWSSELTLAAEAAEAAERAEGAEADPRSLGSTSGVDVN
mmetsp:Transcript_16407/g.36208  ORF Transcript_16407/g.36208 Transcript_16407/m.36208 type:complete len:96 (-) Transcript_16407:56-343(-)